MAGRETDAGPPDAGLPGQLARFVRAQLPDADSLKILGLQRRGGGLSRENWAFDLTVRDGGRAQAIPMMLRRDPVAGLLATDRRVEFGALQALASTPVPAPVAYWLDEDGTWLGFPSLIMSREEGQPDWLALNGDRPENDRLQLARELLDHLIGLQAVDWRATVLAKLLDVPRVHDHGAAARRRAAGTESRGPRVVLRHAGTGIQPRLHRRAGAGCLARGLSCRGGHLGCLPPGDHPVRGRPRQGSLAPDPASPGDRRRPRAAR